MENYLSMFQPCCRVVQPSAPSSSIARLSRCQFYSRLFLLSFWITQAHFLISLICLFWICLRNGIIGHVILYDCLLSFGNCFKVHHFYYQNHLFICLSNGGYLRWSNFVYDSECCNEHLCVRVQGLYFIIYIYIYIQEWNWLVAKGLNFNALRIIFFP